MPERPPNRPPQHDEKKGPEKERGRENQPILEPGVLYDFNPFVMVESGIFKKARCISIISPNSKYPHPSYMMEGKSMGSSVPVSFILRTKNLANVTFTPAEEQDPLWSSYPLVSDKEEALPN